MCSIVIMEKASLEILLGAGETIAGIAARFGQTEATVAYWIRKHGLATSPVSRYASRGGIDRQQLERFVVAGATIAEIAAEVELSRTTVRYWLKRYGLRTTNNRGRRALETRAAKQAGELIVSRRCERHGETQFRLEGRGYYRCMRCRCEAVAKRRRTVKEILVREAGGRCCVCGYDRWRGALECHHLNPTEKRLEINAKGISLALSTLRSEAEKCALLCANCHAEVEGGVITLPARVGNASRPP